jgi:RNA polymerase sigma factor (sigma-70 family)
VSTTAVERAVVDAHRREWAFVLAATARVAGDFDLAEECVQEAYLSALDAWARDGIPRKPGAWLTATAKRKALDVLRREKVFRAKLPLLVEPNEAEMDEPDEDAVPDDRLRLVFTCCHPALAREAQVALTLRLVCGVDTRDIARAFLVSESTMAARLTRAKKKISAARIPYRVPGASELPERLDAVLTVIHLLYTTGHTAPSGTDLVRADLVDRAMNLTRMLLSLMPDEPEVRGLLALLLVTDARRATRTGPAGRLLVLEEQDRSAWDRAAIEEGRRLVVGAFRTGRVGRYALQAAIASLHAEADSYAATDWRQVLGLYDELLKVWPSPVVALNRTVALSMVHGPGAALDELELLARDDRLAGYHYLPAIRADLLRRLGRHAEAATAYRAALDLTDNTAEREFLAARLAAAVDSGSGCSSERWRRRKNQPPPTRRHPMNSSTDTPRATRRQWLGLAVLALPTLLLSLDISVLYLALPRLSADLGANSVQQLWILDIYSFMLAGFLVTMGTLGDRIGRRRLLLIGAAAFGATSVLAAYATSPVMLIAARALLGISGATLMPSTMALIRNMFPDPKQMAAAIGVWFACFMGGMTLGPLVGGLLLSTFWWGSAFLLGVPFMVLLLVTGPVLLPEYRDTAAGRLDLTSVALSLGAILPVIYGLKEIARTGVRPSPAVAVVAGTVIGVLFVRRQRRLADPLLDLRLFANRSFRSALATMLATGIVMAGVTLMSTLYLQAVRGLSPLHAGLWLVPQNLAMAAGSMVAPALTRRIRPAYVMAVGLVVAAFGLLVQAQAGPTDGITAVVAGLTLAGVGISPAMALTMNLIMGATPAEKAGSAASLSETSGELGVALGVAALGSVATVVYRSHVQIPAGAPDTVDHAARQGITAALTVAQQLPGTLRAGLLDAASTAFTAGLTTVAEFGAVVFIALAVLAAVAFRHVPATGTAGAPAAGSPEVEPATTDTGQELAAAAA